MDQGITLDGGGLSPLARGTHSHGDRRRTVDRFIPAGAGNTNGDSLARSSFAVYSRWRGEHLTLAENGFSVRGLSPLARGTHIEDAIARRIARFIPAGAGNTRAVAVVFAAKQVYPRWRGEHAVLVGCSASRKRFIPAGAGNTTSISPRRQKRPVYPRWRGEHHK